MRRVLTQASPKRTVPLMVQEIRSFAAQTNITDVVSFDTVAATRTQRHAFQGARDCLETGPSAGATSSVISPDMRDLLQPTTASRAIVTVTGKLVRPKSSVLKAIVEADRIIATKDIVRGHLIEIVYGPLSPLLDLCQVLHSRVGRLLPGAGAPSGFEKILRLSDARLQDQAETYRGCFNDIMSAPADLIDCRNALIKTLLFFYEMSIKPGGEVFTKVFNSDELHRWLPLASSETFSAVQILKDANRIPEAGRRLLAHRLELTSRSHTSEEARRLTGALRLLDDVLAQHPEMVDARRYVRRNADMKRRERAMSWRESVNKLDERGMRKRFAALEPEIMRRLELTEQLAGTWDQNFSVSMHGDERTALQVSLDAAAKLLRKARFFVSSALEIEPIEWQVSEPPSVQQSHAQRDGRGDTKARLKRASWVKQAAQSKQVADVTRQRLQNNAVLGQAAEQALHVADRSLRDTSILTVSPGQVVEKLTKLTATLALLLRSSSGPSTALRDTLTQAASIMADAQQLKRDEDASMLLAERVELREERKLLYLFISMKHQEVSGKLRAAIALAVASLRQRAGKSRPQSVASQAPLKADEDATPATKEPADVASQAFIGFAESTGASTDAEADSNGWTTAPVGRAGYISLEARRRVDQVFDQGAFESPMMSLRYHFRKHTSSVTENVSPVSEASLMAYIAAARDARNGWDAAVEAHETYHMPSLSDAARFFRVIDNAEVYLVMTEDDDAKIVSFRDRQRYGWAS